MFTDGSRSSFPDSLRLLLFIFGKKSFRVRHVHEKCTPSTAFFLLHFYNRFKFFTSRVARRGQLKAGAVQPLPAGRTLWENPQGSGLEGLLWTGQLKEGSIVQLRG